MKDKTYIGDTSFATWIRRHRGLAGMSIPQFAKELGVCKNTLINWEAGRSEPQRRENVVILEEVCEKAEFIVNDAAVRAAEGE